MQEQDAGLLSLQADYDSNTNTLLCYYAIKTKKNRYRLKWYSMLHSDVSGKFKGSK